MSVYGSYGDVFSLYMGPRLVVVLNGYGVIRDALVNHADVFAHRPHLPFLKLVSSSRGETGCQRECMD